MLSVEPWLVEPGEFPQESDAVMVSVLSVEPWLVELLTFHNANPHVLRFQCSQSSRGWWNQADAFLGNDSVAVSVLSSLG